MKYPRIPIVIASIVIATIVVLLLLGSRRSTSAYPRAMPRSPPCSATSGPSPTNRACTSPSIRSTTGTLYDVRQKSYKETANVPSQDQLPDQRRG